MNVSDSYLRADFCNWRCKVNYFPCNKPVRRLLKMKKLFTITQAGVLKRTLFEKFTKCHIKSLIGRKEFLRSFAVESHLML